MPVENFVDTVKNHPLWKTQSPGRQGRGFLYFIHKFRVTHLFRCKSNLFYHSFVYSSILFTTCYTSPVNN